MERHVRYEVLQSEDEEDDQVTPVPPIILEIVTPPVEESPEVAGPPASEEELLLDQPPSWEESNMRSKQEPKLPPSYNIATSLPSYEEAELSKQEEIVRDQQQQRVEDACQHIHEMDRFTDMQLGTDGMFLCTFMIAFLFNWLGLLASMCITHSVAGRFGAVAGFGLSMVKWVAIVKHNNWAAGIADGDSWLWWMLIALGFLIFFRGCLQYIRIKYQWQRLHGEQRDRMYLLF